MGTGIRQEGDPGGRQPQPSPSGAFPWSRAGEAHHTLLWAHPSRPRSRPLHHTSSAPGYSGPSPCSGIHPLHRSSGLQGGGPVMRGRLLSGMHWEGAVWVGAATEGGGGSSRHCGGRVGSRRLTAVGGLVTAVHTVVVPVTDPDSGDAALGDGALELVGGTGHLGCGVGERMRTCPFHLPRTVQDPHLLPLPRPGLVLVLPAISWEEGKLSSTSVILSSGPAHL